MDEQDLWKNTIFVVVADHGDHSMTTEEYYMATLFPKVINVPQFVYIPNLEQNKEQKALVSQVDILPTILESVGAMAPASIDGRSMLGIMQSKRKST